MKRQEQLIKEIWKKGKMKALEACLDEEKIASFAEALPDAKESDSILEHLARCVSCRDKVVLLHKVKESETYESIPEIPETTIQRTLNIISKRLRPDGRESEGFAEFTLSASEGLTTGLIPKEPIIDIVLRIARGTIMVLNNFSKLETNFPLIAEFAMRGVESPRENCINIRKRFDEFIVDIEVEKADKGVELRVRAGQCPAPFNAQDELSIHGLRVTLISTSGIESYITEGRALVFKDIPYGICKLEISKDGEKIGDVSIDIRENDQ